MAQGDRERADLGELQASSDGEPSIFERPTIPVPRPIGLWNDATPTVPVPLQAAGQSAARTALGIVAQLDEAVLQADAAFEGERISQDDIETLRPPPNDWPQLLPLSIPPAELGLAPVSLDVLNILPLATQIDERHFDGAGASLLPSVREPMPAQARRPMRWALSAGAVALLVGGIWINTRLTTPPAAEKTHAAGVAPNDLVAVAPQPAPLPIAPPPVPAALPIAETVASVVPASPVIVEQPLVKKGPARRRELSPEPSREEVVGAVNALRSKIEACTGGRAGAIELDLRIAKSGRFVHALVGGDFTGSQGSCIARVLRFAKVKPFANERVRVLYRMSL